MMNYKMDNLFQNVLPTSLNLSRKINIKSETTTQKEFDLKDKRNQNIILSKSSGDATYLNSLEKELYILDFENLRNQFNPCAILDNEKITKRCDYFIAERYNKTICIFNEITNTEERYLSKKEETAKNQLLHSLKTINKCSILWKELNSFTKKVCLFSFKTTTKVNEMQKAFNRPLKEGQIPDEEIEKLGFEYRRIGNTHFKIT